MATSSLQLDRYYKDNPLWGGCWCRDELVGKKPGGKFYILNLDESSNPGTHWVACVDFTKAPVYVDPFGLPPPPEIDRFMHRSKNGAKSVYSMAQYQDMTSDNCAYFCVEFIDELLEHGSLKRMDEELTELPSKHNEKEVRKVKL